METREFHHTLFFLLTEDTFKFWVEIIIRHHNQEHLIAHTHSFQCEREIGCCVTCDLLYDTTLVPGDRLGTTIFPYELTEVIQLFKPTNSWPAESTII